MADEHLGAVMHYLRAVVKAGGPTDAELLEAFIAGKDEAAFEALVARHPAMVMGVCRRVLGNSHDAEDAFQATFLVLVRRAASIVPREMAANWLYGVAHQTALKARALFQKRRARERQVPQLPEPEAAQDRRALWLDLRDLLDEELSRLPEKYRAAILLCDLEGKPHKEAARLLGWPVGTLSCNLARGRQMLAEHLARRGLMLPSAALTALLLQNAASAGVSATLIASTARAGALFAAGFAAAGVTTPLAAALTEGTLQAMLMTRSHWTTAALVAVAIFVSGVGGLVLSARGAEGDAPDGVIKAIDPVKNRLVVQIVRDGKKAEKAFALPKGVPVVVAGKAANLRDLKPGMRVGLNMGKGGKGIVGIRQFVQAKGDEKDKGDGQNGQKDDGQKGQKDDGQKGNKDDGQKGQNDDGNKGDGKNDAAVKAAPKGRGPIVVRKR
jgi:RNA polymerase sigma factor (sigma-70 family)